MGFTVVYWNHTKHEVSSKHVKKIYTHLFKGNIYILRFGKQKRLLYVLFLFNTIKGADSKVVVCFYINVS